MTPQPRLTITPCNLADANVFVKRFHRHHEPMRTHKFSLSVVDDLHAVRGVLIAFRPANIRLDDGWTLEISRLATDGCSNACSALYGAAWRVAKAMGYRRVLTYILAEEPGTTLRAAGWKCMGEAGGGTWNRPNTGRLRADKAPLGRKQRWQAGDDPPYPPAPIWPELEPSPQLALDWESVA
ncbi:MAG TPA: XF1762 family protein [Chloroflexota bacterium]|nr:XF1762 family protein [Chloroflexota bacterium]